MVIAQRTQFPDLQAVAYLNHAGVSPLCRASQEGIEEACRGLAEGGSSQVPHYLAKREVCRQQLAQLLGCQSSELAFTQSTTVSINLLAQSLPWRAGDRLLLLRGEFPTNVIPWLRVARSLGLEVIWMEAEAFRSAEGLERLHAHLRAGLRLFAFSAVQFQSGLALPLRDIADLCRQFDCWTFSDLIQAAGVCPLDLSGWGLDFGAGGSHKWLMGIEGLGYLFVSERWRDRLEPGVGGWLSCQNGFDFLFESDKLNYQADFVGAPLCLEFSTLSSVGIYALSASLTNLLAIGPDSIHQHLQRYNDELESQLSARGFQSRRSPRADQRSGTLSMFPACLGDVPASKLAAHWVQQLSLHHVTCASPDGLLRFSPHWPNSFEEIPRVVEAVEHILQTFPGLVLGH